jgi:membrane protein implicated in regulation of membrane protease activity
VPNTPRRPPQHTVGWAVAALVAAALCCAGIPLFVAFGAGAVLASVGAALGKPQVLLPGLAFLVTTVAVVLARRRQ